MRAKAKVTLPEDEDALLADVRQLVDDARALATSEAAFQAARAKLAGAASARIAICAVLALMLVFFALMALVVGAVIALGPLLTAWGAMGAVAGGLVLAALICVALATAVWRRLRNLLNEPAGEA